MDKEQILKNKEITKVKLENLFLERLTQIFLIQLGCLKLPEIIEIEKRNENNR
jgi:hypothetical protein